MDQNTLVGLLFFAVVIYVVVRLVRRYSPRSAYARGLRLQAAARRRTEQEMLARQPHLESRVDRLRGAAACTDEELDEAKQQWDETETEAFCIRVLKEFDGLAASRMSDRIERAEFLAQAVSDGVLLDTESAALAQVVWWRVLELVLTTTEMGGYPRGSR